MFGEVGVECDVGVDVGLCVFWCVFSVCCECYLEVFEWVCWCECDGVESCVPACVECGVFVGDDEWYVECSASCEIDGS